MSTPDEQRKRIAEKWRAEGLTAAIEFMVAEYGAELEANHERERGELKSLLRRMVANRDSYYDQAESLKAQLEETRNALHVSEAARKLELSELLAKEDELEKLEAENNALRALSKLPDNICLSCGGEGGHHEGCHGTTALIALSTELGAELEAKLEKYEGAYRHMNACRALAGTPEDDVLYTSIEELKARLLSQSTHIAKFADAFLRCQSAFQNREHGGVATHNLYMELTEIFSTLPSDDSIGERILESLRDAERCIDGSYYDYEREKVIKLLADLGAQDAGK